MGTCKKLPAYVVRFVRRERLDRLVGRFERTVKRIRDQEQQGGATPESKIMAFLILEGGEDGQMQSEGILNVVETRKDTDFLREKSAYIVLNWLAQQATDKVKRYASDALRKAMYHDRDRVKAALREGDTRLGIN